MLGSLGWEELLVILVILALLFGASRVAAVGGALGRGIREFRAEAGAPVEKMSEPSDTASSPTTADSSAARDTGARDVSESLSALQSLRASGVLTAAEFERKRAALLANSSVA